MRKFALTIALAAAGTLMAPLMQPAEAGVIQPAGIRAALDETRLAEPVHCRPGRWHHRSRRAPDGCRGGDYRRYGYAPAYPYAYGYRPGVTFGFSVGPRRHRDDHHRNRRGRR